MRNRSKYWKYKWDSYDFHSFIATWPGQRPGMLGSGRCTRLGLNYQKGYFYVIRGCTDSVLFDPTITQSKVINRDEVLVSCPNTLHYKSIRNRLDQKSTISLGPVEPVYGCKGQITQESICEKTYANHEGLYMKSTNCPLVDYKTSLVTPLDNNRLGWPIVSLNSI